MINEVIFLQTYGFGGGNIGDILRQWEAAGVFTYALPFLLIFAIVFVILSNLRIFASNKGVNAIISLAVALMALQFNVVGLFFSEIFPRLGVALSVILVIVILGGIFIDTSQNRTIGWIFVIISFVIMGIVIFSSLDVFNFVGASNFGNFLRFNGSNLIIAVIVIGGVIWAISSTSSTRQTNIPDAPFSLFARPNNNS